MTSIYSSTPQEVWNPGWLKPTQRGFYERKPHTWCSQPQYFYWDGEYWCGWACSLDGAFANKGFQSATQTVQWRELEREFA